MVSLALHRVHVCVEIDSQFCIEPQTKLEWPWLSLPQPSSSRCSRTSAWPCSCSPRSRRGGSTLSTCSMTGGPTRRFPSGTSRTFAKWPRQWRGSCSQPAVSSPKPPCHRLGVRMGGHVHLATQPRIADGEVAVRGQSPSLPGFHCSQRFWPSPHPDDTIVIDGGWHQPIGPNGFPMPDPERWPSAYGGKGFKPLADWTHSLGLKFGESDQV